MSNFAKEQIWDATNTANVKPSIGTALTSGVPTFTTAGSGNSEGALVVTQSANSGVPAIVQKTSGTGSGGQASLATSNFTNAVAAGNSIVVVVGVGNNGTIKISDTLGNPYTQVVLKASSTTFQVAIFLATNIKAGTNAVTVTPSASVSLNIVAYEVSGLIGVGGGGDPTNNSTANQQGTVDVFASSNATSTTPASGAQFTSWANEIAFAGIAIGTANQTPSAFQPWSKDFSLVVGGTPSGLFGLHSFSQPLGAPASVSFSATITSEPWACVMATFKPVQQSITAVVTPIGSTKKTYSAFASFTAAAGDIAVLPGAAGVTVRATRVEVSLSTSGTAAIEAIQLVKRSAADSGGTSASMTAVPHDSQFAAAVSAPLNYTGAPSTGAAVGTIRGVQFSDASSALPGANTWLWTFGDRPGAGIVLRGTAEQLAVNLGGAVTTQTATVSFEWTEE